MHQGGYFSTLSRGYGGGSYCRTIQGVGFSLYRDPHATHLRPGHTIHFIIVQRVMPSAGSYIKPKHGLSPPNGWTIEENKSDNGRITENLLQLSGERLGRVAFSGIIHYKQLTIEHDQESPIQTLDGTCTKGTSGSQGP